MAFDPQEELTDLGFPREGSLGQAALLAVAELVERLMPDPGGHCAGARGELSSVVSQLLTACGGWSKEYVEHPERLVADVEDLLVDVGTPRRMRDGCTAGARRRGSLRAPSRRRSTTPQARAGGRHDQSPVPRLPGVRSEPRGTTPGSAIGRWVLHHAGIVNVWQYDRTEITFAGGRALLRGKNGAGKSKALEVLLPFLFDGDTRTIDAPGRDRTSVHWLMTDGREAGNHVGYVWLELRLTSESGEERFLYARSGAEGVDIDPPIGPGSSSPRRPGWASICISIRPSRRKS